MGNHLQIRSLKEKDCGQDKYCASVKECDGVQPDSVVPLRIYVPRIVERSKLSDLVVILETVLVFSQDTRVVQWYQEIESKNEAGWYQLVLLVTQESEN